MKRESYLKRGLWRWWRVSVLVIFLFLVVLYFLPALSLVLAQQGKSKSNEVLAKIPYGRGFGEVGIEEGEEVETWGPTSFDVTEKGNIYLVDGVNSRILILEKEAGTIGQIVLKTSIVCPVDIAVLNEDEIYLLDLPSRLPCVFKINSVGEVVASWLIPRSYLNEGITGFRVSKNGRSKSKEDIFLQIAFNWEVPLVERGKLSEVKEIPTELYQGEQKIKRGWESKLAVGSARTHCKFFADKVGRLGTLTVFKENSSSSKLIIQPTIGESVDSLSFLDVDDEGNQYLLIEENLNTGPTLAFVKKFDSKGNLSGSVPLPLEDFHFYPDHFLKIGGDGKVWLLVPGKDNLKLKRLNLSSSDVKLPFLVFLKERLVQFKDSLAQLFSGGKLAYAAYVDGWSIHDANSRAWEYINLYWYCNRNNYSRSCEDGKPRYLTSPNRYYYSVPYKWGGFHLPSQFVSGIKSGQDAGDIWTNKVTWCSYGVDCSGLVSRLWGLGSKRSTWSLIESDISYPLPNKNCLSCGDILDWPGHHVVYFRYYISGGVKVFESTKKDSWDRTVCGARKWFELTYYKPYRFRYWTR